MKKYVVKTTVTHIYVDKFDNTQEHLQWALNEGSCADNYVTDLIDTLGKQLEYYDKVNESLNKKYDSTYRGCPNCFCSAYAHEAEILREATEEDFKKYGSGE